jgi:hypothetical protein
LTLLSASKFFPLCRHSIQRNAPQIAELSSRAEEKRNTTVEASPAIGAPKEVHDSVMDNCCVLKARCRDKSSRRPEVDLLPRMFVNMKLPRIAQETASKSRGMIVPVRNNHVIAIEHS